MKQNATQGIAIISALLIMVLVLGLGIGGIFLIQNSLRIAENSRSQTIAFYAGESAIELARGQLQAHLDAGNTTLPSSINLMPIQSAVGVNYNYQLDTYTTRNSNTEAVLNVLGFGPNNGEHASVVVLGSAPAAASGDPFTGRGFVSEGTVSVSGFGNASLIDAEIHGNRGYTLNGYDYTAFRTCTSRAPSGLCLSTTTIPTTNGPAQNRVSGGTGQSSYQCNSPGGSNNVCAGNGRSARPSRLVDPVDVSFSTTERRNENSVVYDENGNEDASQCSLRRTNVNGNEWASLYATLSSLSGDAVLCVSGNVNIPSGAVLNNIEIVADSINFNGSSTVEDSVLVARQGLTFGSGTISNSFVYSQNDLNVNNQLTVDDNADIDGDGDDRGGTTFVTEGNLTFSGSTRAGVGESGEPTVSMVAYARGDITYNGSSDNYALYYSGNNFTFNGSSRLYGSAYAENSITVNGSPTIDAGIGIVNDDVEPPARLVVDSISRR